MKPKRTAVYTLLVLLSAVVVTAIGCTNLANANFCFPPTNPNIIFNSPVNTTYIANNVFLNVTIETYLTGWSGGIRDESYSQLVYSVDGDKFQPMKIISKDFSYGNPGNIAQINCSINLCQLSEGNHTLMVKAVFDYYEYSADEDLLHTESNATAYLVIEALLDTPTPAPTLTSKPTSEQTPTLSYSDPPLTTTAVDDKPIVNSWVSLPHLIIITLAVIAAVIASVSVYLLRVRSRLIK